MPVTDCRPVARLAIGTLIFNLLVILWGALVRATGSGAGCGAHWPACDGEILPSFTSIHRVIEFTHRVSVGIGIGLVVWLWLGIRRTFPRTHPACLAVNFTLLFTISESLIGAGLVLFKLVAQDASIYRAFAVSAHLINTFLLIASMTLTVWWIASRPRIRLSGQGAVAWLTGGVLLGALLVGVTGAITALGDTLFAGMSLPEIERTTSGRVPVFVGLRVYHPAAAIAVGLFAALASWITASLRPSSETMSAAYWVKLLVVVQIGAGFLNYLLRVPLAMQLIHLLLADLLWIGLILLAASALAEGAPRAIGMGAKRMTVESTR